MSDLTRPPPDGAAESAGQAGPADAPGPADLSGPAGEGGAAGAERPRAATWPGRAIRGCALFVLLLAALTVVGSALPGWRTTDDLTADLAAGRVTYVEYQPGADTVRWVDDWVRWRQALLGASSVEVPGQPVLGREEEWVRGRIDASGHPVDLIVRQGTGNGWKLWVQGVPPMPLRAASVVVWLLVLVHMLSRGGHRVANRWAWFWLFTIGQSGALLYLLREPVPLWRRELRAAKVSVPTRGGVGFAHAVLLAFGTGVLALGIAVLLH